MSAASVLGHEIDSVMFDSEDWTIICSCLWECCEPEEETAWEMFNDHVFDHANTVLRRQREAAKVVTL